MGADLGLIIAISAAPVAMIGVLIALFLWNRGEANSDRRDMLAILRGIQEEMKDFHIKLERSDSEFKAHMMVHHK